MVYLTNDGKFNVGDSVELLDDRWRGDWLGSNLNLPDSAERASVTGTGTMNVFGGTAEPEKFKVTKVWKRSEMSLNGVREEYYYELSEYPGARFREDLLVGEGSGCPYFRYSGNLPEPNEYGIMHFTTKAKRFETAELQELIKSGVKEEKFSVYGDTWNGFMQVVVKGVWCDEDNVEMELEFTPRLGEDGRDPSGSFGHVKAIAKKDANSMQELRYVATNCVNAGPMGAVSLELACVDNMLFSKKAFCDSLEVLDFEPFYTDAF
ncbi:hypothetical protein D7V86_01465 [bacterium D16-51]|nr:hypothetical protein D7V96_03855 [bacterium D16-59]RKI62894.1 hypothetical protein D7V86_01465 [bacterium D16-51]